MLDLRAGAGDGERSWLDGGLGKSAISGADAGYVGHASVGLAEVSWTPHLTWDLGAVVVGQYQSDHDRSPVLGEAYLTYKPTPFGETHVSARLGMFYPPVSQEHTGPAWIDRDMITPSAINGWIGEEAKVVGGEISVRHDFGERSIGATAGAFGYDDTAGTLLTTRGWGFDDVMSGVPGHYRLPPMSEFMEYVQAPISTPVEEIDHKIGGYGRIDLRVSDRLAFNAFYYDNAGDLLSQRALQWAWATRFWNFGASLDLPADTRVLSQVMIGDTRMGYSTPEIWVDTTFGAAYILVTHKFGDDALSGRVDVFQTNNRTEDEYGYTQERGWAVTADYRKQFNEHVNLLLEAMHIESDRPAREDILGEAPRRSQTVFQAALRVSF